MDKSHRAKYVHHFATLRHNKGSMREEPQPWRVGKSYLFSTRPVPHDELSFQPANYSDRWYSANRLLNTKLRRVFAVLFCLSLIAGSIHNLIITQSLRAEARERIVIHPTAGVISGHEYWELTQSLHLFVGVLIAAVIVFGIVIVRMWIKHREFQRYSRIAETRRQVRSNATRSHASITTM